jgi:ribose/xylose/arabinose/galactoside ABC-type transport system permease subunit
MQKTSTFKFLSSDSFFPFIVVPVTFVLPVIILAVYVFRRKKINKLLRQARESKDAGTPGS